MSGGGGGLGGGSIVGITVAVAAGSTEKLAIPTTTPGDEASARIVSEDGTSAWLENISEASLSWLASL